MAIELSLMTSIMPFFLVLAIVYGALEMSGVFRNRAVNAIIALVIAFFAIMSADVTAFIMQIMPYAAILFVVIFLAGFVISFFRGRVGGMNLTLLAVVAILLLIFLANQGYDILQDLLPSGFPVTGENLVLIIGIVLIIAIFYMVHKSWAEK